MRHDAEGWRRRTNGFCRQYSVDSGAMDREAAFRQLTDYWTLVSRAQKLPMLSGERRATMKVVNERKTAVDLILRSLAPDLRLVGNARTVADHVALWPRFSRALGLINAWRELAECNWSGSSPAFSLSFLDPVISEVAIPLWEANKYRQAVNDAATNLNSFAQAQLGRSDIYDTALMGEAFSGDPPKPGKSRLRCPGDHRLVTVKDQQNGARQITTGAFLAIRNPAHHMTGDWNPVTVFHHLTILSQIAHYFRHWDVVTYVPPPPDLTKIDVSGNQALAKTIATLAQVQAQGALIPPTD
jgi:hypothetical protein